VENENISSRRHAPGAIEPPTSAKQWYFNKTEKHNRSFIYHAEVP
jgi:hypothetical protein